MSLPPPKGELQTRADSPKPTHISSGHDAREPVIFEIDTEEPLNLDITLSSGQTFRWEKEGSDWWKGFIKGNRVFIRQIKTNNATFRFECKTSPLVEQKYLIEN